MLRAQSFTFGKGGPVKVLVVEDDRELAAFVRMGLMDEGFQVVVSFDGDSGLRQAETHAFDSVLLDVMLPVLNGFEVTKRPVCKRFVRPSSYSQAGTPRRTW